MAGEDLAEEDKEDGLVRKRKSDVGAVVGCSEGLKSLGEVRGALSVEEARRAEWG